MRLAVFAYHDIGVECLKTLIEWNEEIVAVVTHRDNPDEEIWFQSVAELARSHSLLVVTPRNPNTPDFVNLVRRLAPDLFLSFYYRRLLSKELLSIPRLGGINLHGSFLPTYRGRCPVNWVLINGETETGVTLHYMVEKTDAGDIVAQKAVPIVLEDTALSLFRKLTSAAVELLREAYPLIKEGKAPRVSQDPRRATKFGGRQPGDGKITWEWPALSIYNLVRAVTHPYPGAFTFFAGRKLYVWTASLDPCPAGGNHGPPGTIEAVDSGKRVLVSTGDGCLCLTRLQFDREEELPAGELVERYRIPAGSRLGQ